MGHQEWGEMEISKTTISHKQIGYTGGGQCLNVQMPESELDSRLNWTLDFSLTQHNSS